MNFDKTPPVDQSPATLAELRGACAPKTETTGTVDKSNRKLYFLVKQLDEILTKIYDAKWFPEVVDPFEHDICAMTEAKKAASRMRYKIDKFRAYAVAHTEGGDRLAGKAKKTILGILKVMKKFGVETEHTPYAQTMAWYSQLGPVGRNEMEDLAIELALSYDAFLGAERENTEQVHEFKKSFGGGMR